jgi:hypothetical protein
LSPDVLALFNKPHHAFCRAWRTQFRRETSIEPFDAAFGLRKMLLD